MANNSTITSLSYRGAFKRESGDVVISGNFNTNEKTIIEFNGTAYKNGEFVCGFNIRGDFPEREQSENALNYNNVVDDSKLEAVTTVIRDELAALRAEIAAM